MDAISGSTAFSSESRGFVEPDQNEELFWELGLDLQFSGERSDKAGSHGPGMLDDPSGAAALVGYGELASKRFMRLFEREVVR
jgi:hypothetical protein